MYKACDVLCKRFKSPERPRLQKMISDSTNLEKKTNLVKKSYKNALHQKRIAQREKIKKKPPMPTLAKLRLVQNPYNSVQNCFLPINHFPD